MPVTKNQLNRLVAIHNKLSTMLHYSLNELVEACEREVGEVVSRRTVYNDLRELRETYGAPIPSRNRSSKPYFYTDSFSLFGVINTNDAALANEALALIRQMSTLPQFQGLEEVLLKFEERPGLLGGLKKSVVQFEQNPQYTGLKHLKPLYDAIQNDYRLLITYCDFSDQRSELEFSSYLLKEYSNRWFVFGWAEGKDAVWNLALDRIESITPLKAKLRRPDGTNWDTYLTDVVGVTRYPDAPLETTVLRVWLPRARYLETKPLHRSQRILQRTSDYVDFQYELRWNRELMSRVLELGPDAELLEPLARRNQIMAKVLQMAGRYQTNPAVETPADPLTHTTPEV